MSCNIAKHRDIERKTFKTILQKKDELWQDSVRVSLLSITDSGRKQTQVQIWPKGNFNWSPSVGFNGEAHYIGYSESDSYQRYFKVADSAKKQLQVSSETGEIQVKAETQKHVIKKTEQIWPIYLSVLLIAASVVWLFLRNNRNN